MTQTIKLKSNQLHKQTVMAPGAEKGLKTLRKVQEIITTETTGTRSQPYQPSKWLTHGKEIHSLGKYLHLLVSSCPKTQFFF